MKEIILHDGSTISVQTHIAEKWDEFCQYRRDIKKPLKPKYCEKLMLWLFSFPDFWIVQIVDTTIRNGWIGLFEPKNYNNGGQQTGKTGTSVNRVEAIKQRRMGGL